MTAPHTTDLPISRYFRLERLGKGVYFAVATPGTGAMGNAGIVDLGGDTLIFDTMLTAQAARDLRAAAQRLTGRAPRYVVNSHFHGDHTMGNAALDHATIIATTATAPLIAQENGSLLRTLRERGAELDAEARAEAAAATDPAVRRDIEQQSDDFLALAGEASETQVRAPNITFDSRLTIHGARRHAQLMTWGGGHTVSDAVLYLPTERILFAGDLIFYRCHASINSGDPAEWLRILGEMERLEIDTLAPGHGDVTSRVAIAEQRGYLDALLALALQAVEAGKTADEAAAAPVPEAYRDFGFASGFAQTMRALFDYQSARVNATGK
ncbi:MAG TPA: MBL fold metallo-hydrolase, partial [Ktedonobacterales bacterium]|nr:MBL fold metallo-hydrolase [Ktedonobacterales bacterium]